MENKGQYDQEEVEGESPLLSLIYTYIMYINIYM